jgi:hypothetical protein
VHEATPSTKATAGTINAFFIETPPKFSRTLIAWLKTLNISDERIYEWWPFEARELDQEKSCIQRVMESWGLKSIKVNWRITGPRPTAPYASDVQNDCSRFTPPAQGGRH